METDDDLRRQLQVAEAELAKCRRILAIIADVANQPDDDPVFRDEPAIRRVVAVLDDKFALEQENIRLRGKVARLQAKSME